MKVGLIVFAIVALAYGQEVVDWSNIIFRTVYPKEFELIFKETGSERIVGGSVAHPGQFPYQAALNLTVNGDRQILCGGSLLEGFVILAAAHCLENASTGIVYLGAQNMISAGKPFRQAIAVSKSDFVIHPEYNPKTFENDIALIKLPVDPQFGAYINTVKLPVSYVGETFAGQVCVASGWGKTNDDDNTISPDLRYVDPTIISNSACKNYFGPYVHNSTICTSGADKKFTCNGDSGGPLVCFSGLNRVVVGITSFGSDIGCQKGYPSAFTRVTSHLEWIRSNTRS